MDEMPQAEDHESNARADEREKGHRDDPSVEKTKPRSDRHEGRDVPPPGSDHDPDSPWLGGG